MKALSANAAMKNNKIISAYTSYVLQTYIDVGIHLKIRIL